MLVDLLKNGWKRYNQSCIWRCQKPGFLVEVGREGYTPSFITDRSVSAKIRKVQSFYNGRLSLGQLDSFGTGLDILCANAMAESNGTVPSRLEYQDLKRRFGQSTLPSPGDRLASVVDYIKLVEPMLLRKEKKLNYVNPIISPGAISMGAHHMLISTALDLLQTPKDSKADAIVDLALRLSSQSLFAAQLAVTYLNKRYQKHLNEPPLIAAIYNAGSLLHSSSNRWSLRSTNDHIDKWIAYYNTSRLIRASATTNLQKADSFENLGNSSRTLELKLVRKEFQPERTIGELYVNEQFQCYTLEDVVREDGIKIKHETAIPKGRYNVTINRSPRFQKDLPVVHNVPGFLGILIHPGNTEKDTSGCILVGNNKQSDRITESRLAFKSLFAKIKNGLQEGSCRLTVT